MANEFVTRKGLKSMGGITFPFKAVSSNYTLTDDDYMIDVTSNSVIISLPSAVGRKGKLYVIKNNGTGKVTIDPNGSETVDGKTSLILGNTNVVTIVSDGTKWVKKSYENSIGQYSTGVFEFEGITKLTSTTFEVSPIKGWVVDDSTSPSNPDTTYIDYPGGTYTANLIATATQTYIYIDSNGDIQQTSTPLTQQERRTNIRLGKLGHADNTQIIQVFNWPDQILSPISQLRDMFDPINLINDSVRISPNGNNLSINNTAGSLYGLGVNFTNDESNPDKLLISGGNPTTFQYRTQDGGAATNTTSIDATKYDNNGVVTQIPSGPNQATNQRIYLTQKGTFRIQYGQTIYNSMSDAIQNTQIEEFNVFSNFVENGILVGILSVRVGATNLSDSDDAKFLSVSKFGENVGSAGGISTTNLQQAYNNSSEPEILTNSTMGALTVKRGSSSDADNVIEVKNGADDNTVTISGSGKITTSTLAISDIALGNSLNNFVVVDGSGNTFYKTITDSNTTYSIKASTQTGGAGLDLDAGGSGSGTDTVKILGSGDTSVVRTDVNTITIESTNTTYTASSGVLLTGTNFTNTDKGSSQDIFKNIAVSGQSTISASSNNDTFTLVGSGGINITTDEGNNEITINSTNTTYTAGGGITLSGTQFSHTDTSSFSMSPLTGATVISDINVDTYGHVTGVVTRSISANDIGAQPAGSYDNYVSWNLYTDGINRGGITSGEIIDFKSGDNIQIEYSSNDNTITINAEDTNTTYTASDGILLTGTNFTNTDRGSSQNIFKNIAVTGQSTVVADNNNDTLTLVGEGSVSITTNATTDTITINAEDTNTTYSPGTGLNLVGTTFNNTDRGSSQNIFKNIAVSGQSTVVADNNNDTLTLVGGSNVSITTNATTDTITINATDNNTDNYVDGVSFDSGNGVLTLSRTGSLPNLTEDLDGRYILLSEKGANNGVATLGSDGKVPSSQLPSYVDDVIEVADFDSLPISGETGKIYVTIDEGDIYRWSGSAYIQINDAVSTADSANTLTTPRTISATGDASWSVSFNGSQNVTNTLTISNNAVDNNKLSDMSANTIKGRISTNGSPQDLTASQVRTLINVENGAQVNVGTNLSMGGSGDSRTINSSTGLNVSVPIVTTSNAGFMSIDDKEKLDSISANANNYTHPTYSGDDINLDTGALSGATVISDLDFNVTTDALGHVTDANASYSTRNITAANIGAASTSHNHTLDSLSNVSVTSIGTNEILIWNGDDWINNTLSEAGIQSQLNGTGFVKANGTSISYDNSSYYLSSNPSGYTSNLGTVTSVNSGNGMTFTNFTTSGTVTLGTPGAVTLTSSNSVSSDSHTHDFNPGGNTSQYITGAGTLVTFPSIPSVNNGTLTMNTSGIATGGTTFTANQSGNSTFTVTVPGTNLSIGVSNGTQVRVDSSTGNNAIIPNASTTLAGLVTNDTQTMSGEKTLLDKLTLISSSLDSTIFDVQGTSGQLFSVVDSLVGSLFSVNDISGIPVFEVFSDDTVKIGTFGAEAIKVEGSDVVLDNVNSTSTELTALFLDSNNKVVRRELGSGAFSQSQSLNLGTGGQIPFMNILGNDFEYSSYLNFDIGSGEFNIGSETDFVYINMLGQTAIEYNDQDGSLSFFNGTVTMLELDTTIFQYGIETNFLDITGLANATVDTDKFLVSDNNRVKYRTGSQMLSDIGAQPAGSYDNYGSWTLYTDNVNRGGITSGEIVNFKSGDNVVIEYSTSNNTITINAEDTNTTYTAGVGLILSGTTFNNTDRGSSQNIFKNIAVSGQSTVTADNNNDTLTLVGGSNVSITTNATTDTITINASDTNTTYTAGGGITLSGTQFSHSDTSSFSMSTLTGATVISDINVDTYGHVTGVITRSISASDIGAQPAGSYDNYGAWRLYTDGTDRGGITSSETVNFKSGSNVSISYSTDFDNTITINAEDTNTTYTAGGGITLSGTQFSHSDTSSQGSVNYSGNTFIQDITLDTYGHITAISGGTVTSITGNSGSSSTISVTNTGTNATYYLNFTSSLSGNQVLRGDTGLTYNPSSNTLVTSTLNLNNVINVAKYGSFENGDITIGDPNGVAVYGTWEGFTDSIIAGFDKNNGLYTYAKDEIRVRNGLVGVGIVASNAKLEVSGSVNGTSIYADEDIVAFSDVSVKENIRKIDNSLYKVLNSRGVIYDRIDSKTKNNIGFIAQELEVHFPELVSTSSDGTKAVKYQNAVAVLFEAIKEQHAEIEEIKKMLNK